MDTLEGQLLIASPALLDPNFRRAVVLITEHTDDASVVRAAGVPVVTVAGAERAAKVTVVHDLEVAELQVGT